MPFKNPYADSPQQEGAATLDPNSDNQDYSFEAAQKDPELIKSVRRYAKNLDNKVFKDDKEAFDWYVNDRRWKDSNVLSTLKELNYVKGGWGEKYASDQDLQDLTVMRHSWDKLPNMFQDIGRGNVYDATEAFVSNIAKGALDPTVLMGGIFGKAASKAASFAAGKAVSAATDAAIKVGTGIAIDAGVTAGADVADQDVRIGLHQQDDVDPWEAIKAGTLGGVLSAGGHYLANRKIDKGGLSKDPKLNAIQAKAGAAKLVKEYGLSTETGLLDAAKTVTLEGNKINREEAAQQLGPENIVKGLEPKELTEDEFTKELSRETASARKGTGFKGVKTVHVGEETHYDPMLDMLTVGKDVPRNTENVKTITSLLDTPADASWRKESVPALLEDGTTTKVNAGTAANKLSDRLQQAHSLMSCLGA
jgi:hypothetical protein